jgi:transposase
MNEMNILPQFKGTAIHDCWFSYFDYLCKHGLCNAHLIRELIFTDEEHHQAWAKKMIGCLLDIKETVSQRKQFSNCLEKGNIKKYEKRYARIIATGLKQNPPPKANACHKKRGRTKQSQPKNLLDRMKAHKDKILAFMYNFKVPFDNNLAERDIRMMKVQQKISGTFRSRAGANIFCRIRSYISTVRKNDMNVLESIRNAIDRNPFVPCL